MATLNNFDIYVRGGREFNINIHSLPFRALTSVTSQMVIESPSGVDNAILECVEATSEICVDSRNNTVKISKRVAAENDLAIHAAISNKTLVSSRVIIDPNVASYALSRLRTLREMDDDGLSVYDNMTLDETNIIIL